MTSSPPLHIEDLSISDLSLLSSPQAKAKKTARPSLARQAVSSSSRGRPSLASGKQQADQNNLRFLQGVNSSNTSKKTTTGGAPPTAASNRNGKAAANKRRVSLFAPIGPSSDADGDGGDESLVGQGAAASSSALPQTTSQDADESLSAAMKIGTKSREPGPPSKDTSSQGEASTDASESKDQIQRQLDELSRMNGTFEAYERMLQGTAGQIELFSERLDSTSSLLSSYIDLLLRSANHQSLLLDPAWQGQTQDQSKHEEAMRELEETLEQRRRQREREEEEREEARLRRELEREDTEKRTATTRGRGGIRGVSSRGGTTRGASTAASRGRPTTTTTTTRTTAAGRGAAGQSSGIVPPGSRTGGTGVRGSTVRGRGTTRS